MVFQSFNLFPHMTILENLDDLGPSPHRRDGAAPLRALGDGVSEQGPQFPRQADKYLHRSFRAGSNSVWRLRAPCVCQLPYHVVRGRGQPRRLTRK